MPADSPLPTFDIISTMGTPANGLFQAAFTYHRRGWRIIPTRGKLPACRWKRFQSAGVSAEELPDLFGRPGVDGLAVILGDGLACRDWDDADAYRRWRDSHSDLAAVLPTVQTARGYHCYFHGWDGYRKLADGEYRADSGHYTILPPSRHPSGSLYRWLVPLPDGELPAVAPAEVGAPPQGTVDRANPAETQAATQRNPSNTLHCVSLPGESLIFPTLPHGPGQRNHCIFAFARRLKAVMPRATPAELRALVTEWHRQALPVIRTKDFAETWSDFQVAWLRVQKPYYPPGLGAAFTRAVANPEPPIDGRAELGILAAACRELQSIAGEKPFPLSARAAANHLGTVLGAVSPMTAWRWLNALQFFGVLAPDQTGSRSRIDDTAVAPMTASTWRYLGVPADTSAAGLLGDDDMGPYADGH